MSDIRMAKASIVPSRRLSDRELATIRAALRLWQETDNIGEMLDDFTYDLAGEDPLSTETIGALIDELAVNREVRVCRLTK